MDGGGSHTQSLANLKRELAQETAAARTIDAEADAALADLAHARDAVVVARADQDSATVKKATAARDEAERRASELADKQAAALIRAQRAEQAAQAYETEHARDLVAELEPDATEAVQDLRRHAAEPVAADRRWRDVSAEVSRMLQHVGNTAPHHNARGEHKLTPIIKSSGGPAGSSRRYRTGSASATTRQSSATASGAPSASVSGHGPQRHPEVSFGPASHSGPSYKGAAALPSSPRREGSPPEVPPSARQAAGLRGPQTGGSMPPANSNVPS